MHAMTITLDLPASIDESAVRLRIAMTLFADETLSLGRAAEVAGLTTRAFWDALVSHGIPVIVYDDEAWEQDKRFLESFETT